LRQALHRGRLHLIDGSTGKIYDGFIPTVDATIVGEFQQIMDWAVEFRT
jgi:pyruvate,orthophosphate dikinase